MYAHYVDVVLSLSFTLSIYICLAHTCSYKYIYAMLYAFVRYFICFKNVTIIYAVVVLMLCNMSIKKLCIFICISDI